MAKILISSCLLGKKVRYDGQDNLQLHQRLHAWLNAGKLVSICPEVIGGLPTPRAAAEIQPGKNASEILSRNGCVKTIDKSDVTAEYIAGAKKALAMATAHNIRVAILKARSPSCGSGHIYDGTFTGTIIAGDGITAALLKQHGISVFNESQIDEALDLAETLDTSHL